MALQLNKAQTILREPEVCRYTKEIHNLNSILLREFGERNGYPRFRWMLYSELTFTRRVDDKIIPVSSFTGIDGENRVLYNSVPVYEQRSFAELHGIDGWVVAEFIRHGMSHDAHLRTYGTQIPYNPHGKYESVGGTELDFTQAPNENINQLVIALLRSNIGLTERDAEQLNEQDQQARDKKSRESFNTSLDIIENTMTAFGEDPGKKGSTAFQAGIKDDPRFSPKIEIVKS